MPRTILVSGVTGKQGGALIESLLSQNADVQIFALNRNISSSSSQRLASKSSKISVIQGNLDDTEAVFAEAVKISPRIWGVFSVFAVNMGGEGSIVEERQGKNFVNSAIKHGVEDFIYTSSVRNEFQATDVPHVASKHNVEEHLNSCTRNTGMKWAIIRPVAFMENLYGGWLGKVFATGWQNTIRSRGLQVIATEDIGRVAAKIFVESQRYEGAMIELAGDELTFDEMAAIYKEISGSKVPTTFGFLITILFCSIAEFRLTFNFFHREGFGVDLARSREMLPEIQGFRAWITSRNAVV